MPELNVETRGRGPKLVLLHGWGLNLRVWDGLAAALEDRFQLIALDLPGHGRSPWSPEAGTLQGLAEALRRTIHSHVADDPYALLGWSLGGQAALWLAAAQRERIDKLLLVATTPRFVAAPDWPHGMAPEVLQHFANQLATDYRRTVSDFLELQVRGSAQSDTALRSLRAALMSHGEARPEALAAGLEILKTSDLRAMLPDITQPALVISGQYDRVTPSGASQLIAASLTHAQHIQLRRAAHAPFLSHPQEFNSAVTEFLSMDMQVSA